MLKKHIFVLILLASLLFSCCPARAQIVHEDPDSLPVHDPYDADRKLALSLQEMFGSLDSFAANINASNFQASQSDIRLFLASYSNFTDVYMRSGLNGSDMEAVAGKLAFMADDLNATLDGAKSYSYQLQQFQDYLNSSDAGNAATTAARLQLSYRNVTDSAGAINANSTDILRILDRTDFDTTGLEKGIASMGNFTASVGESNRGPSGLLGSSSLTLAASTREVAAGDYILLSGILHVDGAPAGHLIRFYMDGLPIGSATTDWNGVGTLVYRIGGRSFDQTMTASAGFDPNGDQLSPAVSNVIEISHEPEMAQLEAEVTPRSAACGDTVNIYGKLATASGFPAAFQTVTILMAGAPAGTAVTGEDGSFSLPYTIRPDMPAGECSVQSSYVTAPGCVLMNATSNPALVVISPDTSAITLNQAMPVYHGGESATFQGSLVTGAGRPVAGANVTIFAGDAPVGSGVTDDSGQYNFVTSIPYNITPGSHDVYASFDPGEGKALTGSRSASYSASFEPAAPQITVRGIPVIAFPGDELNLTGVVTSGSGGPLQDLAVSIGLPAAIVTAVTDTNGSYQAAYNIGGWPGIYMISARVPGEGLLSGEVQGAGILLFMPFDRTGMAIVVIVILLVVSLFTIKLTGASRKVRRGTAPSSGPATPVHSLPRPEMWSAHFNVRAELRKIEPAVTGQGDLREAMLSIYRVALLMLRDRDPSLPGSVTHRELYRMIAGERPSLAPPLGTITGHYEDAAFGHIPPTRDEVVSSLRSLNEMRGQLYDDGGRAL